LLDNLINPPEDFFPLNFLAWQVFYEHSSGIHPAPHSGLNGYASFALTACSRGTLQAL
jgi:hypothetical protein